jgi:hypothetical protein
MGKAMTSNAEGALTNAILDDVMDERMRQRDQLGFVSKHDDLLTNGALAIWAAVRALTELPVWEDASSFDERRKELIQATALLVAEIERIERANKQG